MPTKMPPIYILFLIYAVYYFQIDAKTKKHFSLFLPIFQMMGASVKLITDSPNAAEFTTIFTKYFPTTKFPENPLKLITGGVSNKKTTYDLVNICYAINIQLQVVKGKSVTDKDLQTSKCQGKIIAINKSLAALIGQKYKPAPDYSQYVSKNNKTAKNQAQSGGNVTKRHGFHVRETNKTNKMNKMTKYNMKNKTCKNLK
jgi:hypothetical protein